MPKGAAGDDDGPVTVVVNTVPAGPSWYVKCKMWGSSKIVRTVDFLIDTGANPNILHSDIFDSIPCHQRPMIHHSNVVLRTASGDRLTIRGETTIAVVLNGRKHNIRVIVADLGSLNGILGMQFLEENACIIDVCRGVITIGDKEVPMIRLGATVIVDGSSSEVTADETVVGVVQEEHVEPCEVQTPESRELRVDTKEPVTEPSEVEVYAGQQTNVGEHTKELPEDVVEECVQEHIVTVAGDRIGRLFDGVEEQVDVTWSKSDSAGSNSPDLTAEKHVEDIEVRGHAGGQQVMVEELAEELPDVVVEGHVQGHYKIVAEHGRPSRPVREHVQVVDIATQTEPDFATFYASDLRGTMSDELPDDTKHHHNTNLPGAPTTSDQEDDSHSNLACEFVHSLVHNDVKELTTSEKWCDPKLMPPTDQILSKKFGWVGGDNSDEKLPTLQYFREARRKKPPDKLPELSLTCCDNSYATSPTRELHRNKRRKKPPDKLPELTSCYNSYATSPTRELHRSKRQKKPPDKPGTTTTAASVRTRTNMQTPDGSLQYRSRILGGQFC